MFNTKILASGLLVLAAAGYGVYEFLSHWEYYPTIVFVDKPKQYQEGQEEQAQTYRELFASRNIPTVNEDVGDVQMANILLGRMFPNYRKQHRFSKDQLFAGSPALTLDGYQKNTRAGRMFILKKNKSEDLAQLRDSCIAALNKPMPDKTKVKNDPQYYRLREWCTISSVKDVLKRHKFKLPQKDADWKQILTSEWITNPQYQDQQSFFTVSEMQKMREGTDDAEKVMILKNRCDAALNKTFTRSYFPATTSFLKSMNQKADEFQEAALFCTMPTTVEDYIQKAMQGKLRTDISSKEVQNDFCYEPGMEVNKLRQVKTTDPMGGKTFWCAVRIMYEKKDHTLSGG